MNVSHSNPPRAAGLDSLRILACLMVVLFHLTFRGNAPDSFLVPRFDGMGEITRYGFLGVELFFMISGFVIMETAARRSAMEFFIARATRLLPAFWICCTLTFFAVSATRYPEHAVSVPEFLQNMTLLGGWLKTKPVDSSYWSLTVELHFYFLVLIGIGLGMMRRVAWMSATWLFASSLLLLFPVTIFNFFLIPYWSCYFVAGIAFWLLRHRRDRTIACGLLAVSLPLSCWLLTERLPALSALMGAPISTSVTLTLACLLYTLMALATQLEISAGGHLLKLAANATYPLYLLHQNAGYVLMNGLYPALPAHVALAATLLLLAAASVTIHCCMEQPVSSWVRRIVDRATQR